MRFLPLLLVCVLGVCALGACAGSQPPPDVPVRVDSLQAAPASGPAAADGEDALAAARQRWAAQNLDDYRFTYTRGCFCPEPYRGPFEVTVRGGEVVDVAYLGEGEPADRALSEYQTVESLLALIAEAYGRDAATVRVTYDDATGRPTEIYIDYDEQMADEEVSFTVEAARPLGE